MDERARRERKLELARQAERDAWASRLSETRRTMLAQSRRARFDADAASTPAPKGAGARLSGGRKRLMRAPRFWGGDGEAALRAALARRAP